MSIPMFKLRPDIFPDDFACRIELELWGRFVKNLKK